ncbi:hypothetical protein F9K77_07135 [Ochrobactrum sp. LMG 5442]|nr:hypothetical protein F9K77_07135 [Ochrobactrum sp. LMG 5442]
MKTTDLETAREWQATAQKVYADAQKWLDFNPASADAKEYARRARRQVLEAAAQVSKLETGADADPLQILAVLEQVPGHRLSGLVNELQASAA